MSSRKRLLLVTRLRLWTDVEVRDQWAVSAAFLRAEMKTCYAIDGWDVSATRDGNRWAPRGVRGAGWVMLLTPSHKHPGGFPLISQGASGAPQPQRGDLTHPPAPSPKLKHWFCWCTFTFSPFLKRFLEAFDHERKGCFYIFCYRVDFLQPGVLKFTDFSHCARAAPAHHVLEALRSYSGGMEHFFKKRDPVVMMLSLSYSSPKSPIGWFEIWKVWRP